MTSSEVSRACLVRKPSPEALSGAVEHYLLLNSIAMGNQGTVYFAIPKATLPPRSERTPGLMLKLLQIVKVDHVVGSGAGEKDREVRVLLSGTCSSLAIPFQRVPKLHCIDSLGCGWMATSYCGISLTKFADLYNSSSKVFPVSLAWRILGQLLKIFAYLHSGIDVDVRKGTKSAPMNHKAITHGDLITDNVCVLPQGFGFELCVIDFGWGTEHEGTVEEGYSILEARHDVQRIADMVHWLLHREPYWTTSDPKTFSYCRCTKSTLQLSEYAEIIKFMDQFSSQNEPDQLTAAEALAQWDSPELRRKRVTPILPLAWKDVIDDNRPDGDGIMRAVEFVEDWEAGKITCSPKAESLAGPNRWKRTILRPNGGPMQIGVRTWEAKVVPDPIVQTALHRNVSRTDHTWDHLIDLKPVNQRRQVITQNDTKLGSQHPNVGMPLDTSTRPNMINEYVERMMAAGKTADEIREVAAKAMEKAKKPPIPPLKLLSFPCRNPKLRKFFGSPLSDAGQSASVVKKTKLSMAKNDHDDNHQNILQQAQSADLAPDKEKQRTATVLATGQTAYDFHPRPTQIIPLRARARTVTQRVPLRWKLHREKKAREQQKEKEEALLGEESTFKNLQI